MNERTGEDSLRDIGLRLAAAARRRNGLFDPMSPRGRLFIGALDDPELRTRLFRFVDALPQLPDDAELAEHFRAYLSGHALGGLWGRLLRLGERPTLAFAVRHSVRRLARLFLAEESPRALSRLLERQARRPASVSLDAVGEAVLTEAEADAYRDRVLRLVAALAGTRDGDVSVKLSALTPRFDPIDPEGSAQRVAARLTPIAHAAQEAGVSLTVDMEQAELKPLIQAVFQRLALERPALGLGIALQAYLKDAPRDLEALLAFAGEHRRRLAIRLVKGAYWDSELAWARQRNWAVPVFTDKARTDLQYEALTRRLLENTDRVYPMIAGHNMRGLAHAIAHARALNLPAAAWEAQVLRGMAEPLGDALIREGARLRVYVPTGELMTGMAYLIRRLLENTAGTSILRQVYAGRALDTLLAPPVPAARYPASRQERSGADRAPEEALDSGLRRNDDAGEFRNPGNTGEPVTHTSIQTLPPWGRVAKPGEGGARQAALRAPPSPPTPLPTGEGSPGWTDVSLGKPAPHPTPFANAPLTDFSQAPARQAFRRALGQVRGELGRDYPLDGGGDWIVSTNPARPDEVVGRVQAIPPEAVDRAVAEARAGFHAWCELPASERAARLRTTARLLDTRRARLAAWIVLEAGKNWREADADVAEAQDVLRYYAAQAEALDGWRPTRHDPGEASDLRFEAVGPAAVVAPWNFPLAILAGMSAAALAAGCSVLLKPASLTPVIAWHWRQTLLEAGIPAQAVQWLPGAGGDVGRRLVAHPEVAAIAFTGSRDTGLAILEAAHARQPGQRRVKRVACEMGGKNALIVDADADLDEAVAHALASAFGYQGQKCSAASRLIAVGRVHDPLVKRLAEALDAHQYGPPEDPACVLGPLIDAQAVAKARDYLEVGRGEGRLAFRGRRMPEDGHYFAPALFTGIAPHHRLAREEIFAPVLAVLAAPDFDRALDMALDSDYALTGGVISRHPAHLEAARRRFRVGNLYLNRRITGAQVGAQPFGGVALSGSGVQAGGPEYLKQFLWSRVATENTLRHGFVPASDADP